VKYLCRYSSSLFERPLHLDDANLVVRWLEKSGFVGDGYDVVQASRDDPLYSQCGPSDNTSYRVPVTDVPGEWLENVFARHERIGRATREAAKTWGLDIVAVNPAEYSGVLTAVMMPEGRDADAFRQLVLERFDMSLGTGLGKLKGKIFRIGHLGDFNDLMLAGTLGGVEMGLKLADVPHKPGGVLAALESLASESLQSVS